MEALANLGIDVSGIVLYLVNFGLLILILTKLLYRPVFDFIEKRRETIQTNLNEAEEIRRRFEEEFAKKEAEYNQKIKQMEAEVIEAKQSAEKQSKAIIEEAESKRLRMIQEARVVIGQMKEDLHADVEKDVISRVQRVVSAILQKRVPAEVIEESVQQEWQALKK